MPVLVAVLLLHAGGVAGELGDAPLRDRPVPLAGVGGERLDRLGDRPLPRRLGRLAVAEELLAAVMSWWVKPTRKSPGSPWSSLSRRGPGVAGRSAPTVGLPLRRLPLQVAPHVGDEPAGAVHTAGDPLHGGGVLQPVGLGLGA